MRIEDRRKWCEWLGHSACFKTWWSASGTHVCIRPLGHDGICWSGCCNETIDFSALPAQANTGPTCNNRNALSLITQDIIPSAPEWKAGEHPEILKWEHERFEALYAHYIQCDNPQCLNCKELSDHWKE